MRNFHVSIIVDQSTERRLINSDAQLPRRTLLSNGGRIQRFRQLVVFPVGSHRDDPVNRGG